MPASTSFRRETGNGDKMEPKAPKPVRPPPKKMEEVVETDEKGIPRGTKTRPRNTPRRGVAFFMPELPKEIEFTP
jgi:hypothetical protein